MVKLQDETGGDGLLTWISAVFTIIMTAGMIWLHESGPTFPQLSAHSLTDIRCSFAQAPLPDDQVTSHLAALIRTYLTTMASIGAETWIMHGTLLSWWWNQKVSR